jgi:hypothetical protein
MKIEKESKEGSGAGRKSEDSTTSSVSYTSSNDT